MSHNISMDAFTQRYVYDWKCPICKKDNTEDDGLYIFVFCESCGKKYKIINNKKEWNEKK